MEGTEALQSGYRWVAWVKSGESVELLGEVGADTRLEVEATALAMPTASIEEVLISEESTKGDLPESPSKRIWMRGEFPGSLQMLGLEEDAFSAATAEVHLTGDHIEVTASGLPGLPTGFAYALWLDVDTGHDDEHADNEAMQTLAGILGGGTFMENDLDMIATIAQAATLTIESDHGNEMMSSATALRGAVVLTAEEGTSPEPSEPAGHSH
jgi:hypothetical protein